MLGARAIFAMPMALAMFCALQASATEVLDQGASRPSGFVLTRTRAGLAYEVIFASPSGAALSRENFTLTPSGLAKTYSWKQFQTGEEASIVAEASSLCFTYRRSGGSTEKKDCQRDLSAEDLARVIVPPMIWGFVQSHWDEMEKKGDAELRIAVPDRLDTYGFKFVKSDESTAQEAVWILRASSPFVRMKVSPITFIYRRSDKKLLEIRGMVPPVKPEQKTDIDFRGRR